MPRSSRGPSAGRAFLHRKGSRRGKVEARPAAGASPRTAPETQGGLRVTEARPGCGQGSAPRSGAAGRTGQHSTPETRPRTPRLLALRQCRATPALHGSGTGRPEGRCAARSSGRGSGGCAGRAGGRSSPGSGDGLGGGRSIAALRQTERMLLPATLLMASAPEPRSGLPGGERGRSARPSPVAVRVVSPLRGSLPRLLGEGGRGERGCWRGPAVSGQRGGWPVPGLAAPRRAGAPGPACARAPALSSAGGTRSVIKGRVTFSSRSVSGPGVSVCTQTKITGVLSSRKRHRC